MTNHEWRETWRRDALALVASGYRYQGGGPRAKARDAKIIEAILAGVVPGELRVRTLRITPSACSRGESGSFRAPTRLRPRRRENLRAERSSSGR